MTLFRTGFWHSQDQNGPFWPREVYSGPFRFVNRTLATADIFGANFWGEFPGGT